MVFGDDDDYLEESTSVATIDKQVYEKTTKLKVESKKPAWIDSEEVTEEMLVIISDLFQKMNFF